MAYRTGGGIAAASEKGPFGKGALARAWVALLEASPDDASALRRGANTARGGFVQWLIGGIGGIQGRVLDNYYRYTVSFSLPPIAPDRWGAFLAAAQQRPALRAQLLAGQVPPSAFELAQELEMPLMPTRLGEIHQNCFCTEHTRPCRHLAAAFLIYGEEIDRDPLRFLQFRGLPRGRIYRELGEDVIPSNKALQRMPTFEPATFWDGDPNRLRKSALFSQMGIDPPIPDRSLVQRLGPPPLWSGNLPPEALEMVVDAIGSFADGAMAGEANEELVYDEDTYEDDDYDEIGESLFDQLAALGITGIHRIDPNGGPDLPPLFGLPPHKRRKR